MKNKILFTITVWVIIVIPAFSVTHKITNSGNSFSPANISINVGDTVSFEISYYHNTVEVSKSTYDANDSVWNKGFALPSGGGKHVFNTAGTYYYVCQPHASLGMKGIITVGVTSKITTESILSKNEMIVYPNPAKDFVNIKFNLLNNDNISVSLFDVTGRQIQKLISAQYLMGESDQTYSLNENIMPGRYFIRMSTSNGSVTKPLIIIKR
jgi:plastocyanin